MTVSVGSKDPESLSKEPREPRLLPPTACHNCAGESRSTSGDEVHVLWAHLRESEDTLMSSVPPLAGRDVFSAAHAV